MSFLKKTGVYIIGEAGDNHNGDINLAYKLLDLAKSSGVDAFKSQTFVSELVTDLSALQADYQASNTGIVESQFYMIKKLELPQHRFPELKKRADKIGIDFICTPFDNVSVDTLGPITKAIKVSSGDLVNFPLLVKIASKNLPVILSSGMAEMDEVEFGVKTLKDHGVKHIGLLHCVSNYPADLTDCNLRVITTLKQKFPDLVIGWSDHTLGNAAAMLAVALGAEIIEKHYTLDKNLPGPDHLASADPNEIVEYVNAVRKVEQELANGVNREELVKKIAKEMNAENALGDGNKRIMESEKSTAAVAKRSLFAARSIKMDEVFAISDLLPLRPADGISPRFAERIIGQKAVTDIVKGTKLEWEMIAQN